jgi:predicted TIM-barrel fold metal-dependent hydrolase
VTYSPIVDAHHHIWWLDRTPWLQGPAVPRIFGDYEPLRRDYTIEEYAADARPHGIAKSVYVQVNVTAADAVNEVAWVTEAGASAHLVNAVVAWADLASPDVGEILDRQCAFPTLRGIRQQLHWHENPAFRFAETPVEMLDRAWQRGLREVAARNLLFELQVFPDQIPDALKLIDAFPDTTFVLLHAGMLVDRSPEGWTRWRNGMRRIAERPNVVVKLSGLGTFLRRCTTDDWRPVVEQTIELFGPRRCMFGSNFPVEKLWTSYAQLIAVFEECVSGLDAGELRAVLHDTAARVYRL